MDTVGLGKKDPQQKQPLVAHRPPRFSLPEQKEEMLEYLEEKGYVVVAGVVSGEEIEQGKDLFWKYMDLLNDTSPGQESYRNKPETWMNRRWPGNPRNGIFNSFGANQSEFNWSVRMNPKVQEVFQRVWDVPREELVTSFDGLNAFRPWKYDPQWVTDGGWWHVDQNGYNRPQRQGKCCFQGLVSFYDADETTGGFCVIPGSHKHHERLCETSEDRDQPHDFLMVKDNEKGAGGIMGEIKERILVCFQAGDMVVWDSRTIHCNSPAPTFSLMKEKEKEEKEKEWDLIRLVSYVCMIPRARCTQEVLEQRVKLWKKGGGTSHWPDRLIISGLYSPELYDFPPYSQLSREKRLLIGCLEDKEEVKEREESWEEEKEEERDEEKEMEKEEGEEEEVKEREEKRWEEEKEEVVEDEEGWCSLL